MKKTGTFFAAFVCAMLLAFCGKQESTQPAAQKAGQADVSTRQVVRTVQPDYTIKLAYLDAGTWPSVTKAPLPEHAFGLVFKSVVEANSNGKIAVELYPNDQLGGTKEVQGMVQTGSVEMVSATGTAAALYPALQVFFLPYVFKSDEIAWWIFDNSKFWKDMAADFEKQTGLTILGVGNNGTRHFTNSKRPIHSPKDMAGLKFRVMQSPIYVTMVESMGAQATPLASGEIYTACQTGVVDGQENPVWNIVANKWYEVQKYITLDGHVWSENFVMINSKFYNSLPEEYKHILKIATVHAVQADRTAEDLASRVLDFNVIQDYMEVYTPTAEEMQQFKDAAAPTYDWLRGQIGNKVVDDFLAAVKEAEAYYGYK